jgi:hypothetical protein
MESYRTEEKEGIFLSLIHVKTEQIQHEDVIPILQKVSGTSNTSNSLLPNFFNRLPRFAVIFSSGYLNL